jgi:superfamily II DNA or RNA helicase
LGTTQRIGRALRLDKTNPDKVANVIDFILKGSDENEYNADKERKDWLTGLSKIRGGKGDE